MDFTPAFEQLQAIIESLIALLPNILIATGIFLVFVILSWLIRAGVERVARRAGIQPSPSLVLGRLGRFLALLAGLMVALAILVPSFGAGQMIELLGITGVAIGFAFRDILQNFLAGILILITQPFRLGDQIIVNEFEGTVEEIHTRATYIRTYDGKRVVIPNTTLFTEEVIVNTAFPIRRTEVEIVIGYRDDISTVQKLMIEAMLGIEEVLDHPSPDAVVVSLTGNGVTLKARWWTRSVREEVISMQNRVLCAIKAKLYDEQGVDLPYETRQVLFHDQTEEVDGNRRLQRAGWPARPGEEPPAPRKVAGSIRRLANAVRSTNGGSPPE